MHSETPRPCVYGPPPIVPTGGGNGKKKLIVLILIIIATAIVGIFWFFRGKSSKLVPDIPEPCVYGPPPIEETAGHIVPPDSIDVTRL